MIGVRMLKKADKSMGGADISVIVRLMAELLGDTRHNLHIDYNYFMNQQERGIKSRLSWFRHFHEKSQNIAKTCRYFGISRPTFYYWLKRYKSGGQKALSDLSRRPKNSPKAIDPLVIRKIIKLRKKLQYGPSRIAQELDRRYGIKLSGKTVYAYLKKRKLNRL